jgi:hypothetical protein
VQHTRSLPSGADRIVSRGPVLPASADAELRLIHLNPAWEGALGWQPEDLAARSTGCEGATAAGSGCATRQLLGTLGVHYAQGYHFGRPAPLG